MLLYFKDAITHNDIAINPQKVIAVFTAPENVEALEKNVVGKTVIHIPSGTIAVTEDYMTVVGRINGELK